METELDLESLHRDERSWRAETQWMGQLTESVLELRAERISKAIEEFVTLSRPLLERCTCDAPGRDAAIDARQKAEEEPADEGEGSGSGAAAAAGPGAAGVEAQAQPDSDSDADDPPLTQRESAIPATAPGPHVDSAPFAEASRASLRSVKEEESDDEDADLALARMEEEWYRGVAAELHEGPGNEDEDDRPLAHLVEGTQPPVAAAAAPGPVPGSKRKAPATVSEPAAAPPSKAAKPSSTASPRTHPAPAAAKSKPPAATAAAAPKAKARKGEPAAPASSSSSSSGSSSGEEESDSEEDSCDSDQDEAAIQSALRHVEGEHRTLSELRWELREQLRQARIGPSSEHLSRRVGALGGSLASLAGRIYDLRKRLRLARGNFKESDSDCEHPAGDGKSDSERPDEEPITDTPSVLLSLLSHCRREHLATWQRRVETARGDSHGVASAKDVRRLASCDRKLKHLAWMMREFRARLRRAIANKLQ
jgi:hypothetical protein